MSRRVVVIDNYDSFTYNLVQYLEELGASCDVRRNDVTTPDAVLDSMPHGVVISPGPGTPDEAGISLGVLAAARGKVSVLGVCLGHQAVGQYFGARVRRATRPMHGRTSPVHHAADGLFRGIPSPFAAGRYHSLVVDGDTLPSCLAVTATTADGEIMALRHRQEPIEGIQFHPESILSEYGKVLLGNWLEAL